MGSFSTHMTDGFIHGLAMLVLFFFGGLLIEGAMNISGALTAYGFEQWTIPSLMGAFFFLMSLAYEYNAYKKSKTVQPSQPSG